jgi:DMSO/TMAO reductase YedYZ molybdopterin-dependent catalytic subunit
MKFIRFVVSIVLLAASLASMACTSMDNSVMYAKEATFAAIGYEAGQRMVSFPNPLQLIVRVTVNETLVGEPVRHLEAISPCALPIRDHEKVVVAHIQGKLVVYPADIYEQSFRLAFRKGR